MKFEETDKIDKYECYETPSGGNFIAKCVFAGAFVLTFSIKTPKIYAVHSSKPAIEWVAENCQNEFVQVDNENAKPLIDTAKLVYYLKIEAIGKLQQNWNSYGADKPNSDAVRNARHLLEVFDDKMLDNLSVDNIYASDYGSIIMDFETARGLVSLEIGDVSMGFYTDFSEGDNYAAEGISTDFMSVPKTLEHYLS